jgi:hypothetical protein
MLTSNSNSKSQITKRFLDDAKTILIEGFISKPDEVGILN